LGVGIGVGVAVGVGAGVAMGVDVAVGVGVDVAVGVGVDVAVGVGVDVAVGVGVGVNAGINVDKGVGSSEGVSNGDGDGDSADAALEVSFGVVTGSPFFAGLGLGIVVSPGSTQLLTLFPLTKVACNVVFPCIRMTGPSNFPRTILPV